MEEEEEEKNFRFCLLVYAVFVTFRPCSSLKYIIPLLFVVRYS